MSRGHYQNHELVNFIEPLGFIDYCNLQINSRLVLSDSGSISEECAILQFKALTLRDSMERPEALETGVILMTGLATNHVINAIEYIETLPNVRRAPQDYLIDNTSERVLNFLLSTYHVRDFWAGRR